MQLLRAKDRITGKERLTNRAKMPLYIPGRIIHVSYDSPLNV